MRLEARRSRPGHAGFAAPGACARPHPAWRGVLAAGACTVAALLCAAGPSAAQQPVVIGGGGPAAESGGVIVNDNVLDSLGSAGPAPALPSAPAMAAPGAPVTAYRLPDTGQLVVRRPGTLLYPPMQAPHSRLAVPPAAGVPRVPAPKAPMTAAAEAKPKSRLLVAPVAPSVEAPTAPVAEAPIAAVPAPAPKMPAPKVAAPEPPAAPSASVAATAAPPPEPKLPPPPPALSAELQAESSPPPAPKPAVRAEPAPVPPSASETLLGTKATGTQAATLPAATGTPDRLRVLFDAGSADLSDAARAGLGKLADTIAKDASARVQLLAYATSADGSSSRARRLSLSRALAVRAFLIDKGIRSTRMDVRALGDKVQDGPPDRVDVLPQGAGQ